MTVCTVAWSSFIVFIEMTANLADPNMPSILLFLKPSHAQYTYSDNTLLDPFVCLAEVVKTYIHGAFGQSNMHHTLCFCLDQQGRNQMYPKLKSS